MPSIPQSLLWISLVVLWLFVLVPMLISKRDAVRRTSDVALATRVLNSGAAARLLRRGGPAAGHPSDPDWQPTEDEFADLDDDLDKEDAPAPRSAVMKSAAVVDTGPDYLDVDVVEEDSAALPVGASAAAEQRAGSLADDLDDVAAEFDSENDEPDDDDSGDIGKDVSEQADLYEYIDDTSGLEVAELLSTTVTPAVSRRHRYDSTTAAAVSARKYTFRKRVLMTMALILVVSATAAFKVAPIVWWVCGSAAGMTALYLGYLRRQTRIEERLRRRRLRRLARSRLGVENTDDREFDVVPSRLRRPGAVVLEIDDEDPVFEHLDYAPFARDYDLPRAAGQ